MRQISTKRIRIRTNEVLDADNHHGRLSTLVDAALILLMSYLLLQLKPETTVSDSARRVHGVHQAGLNVNNCKISSGPQPVLCRERSTLDSMAF